MPRVPIRTIIETWKTCGQNFSVAASQLGIDRRTVKRWVDLGRQPPPAALVWDAWEPWTGAAPPASGRSPKAAAQVRGWRETTGFCRKKLVFFAQRDGIQVSASTIHRYLHLAGLVCPSTKRRRPRFQNGQVMRPSNCPGLGYLQMDVTPELSKLPSTC